MSQHTNKQLLKITAELLRWGASYLSVYLCCTLCHFPVVSECIICNLSMLSGKSGICLWCPRPITPTTAGYLLSPQRCSTTGSLL